MRLAPSARLTTLLAGATLLLGAALAPAQAAPAATTTAGSVGTAMAPLSGITSPSAITNWQAHRGPGAGQVTFSWSHSGTSTSYFELEIGNQSFGSASTPKHAGSYKILRISRTARSYVLSAADAAVAGSPVGSGNAVYYRFRAVHATTAGRTVRVLPYLRAIQPGAPALRTATRYVTMSVGTYNVASAKATYGIAGHEWRDRVDGVARTIAKTGLGIVGIQELSPGSANGDDSIGGTRQTQSLVTSMHKWARDLVPGSDYQLVRTSPYVKPGTVTGSQGARILYDRTRYQLTSACSDYTGDSFYSGSCTITMPVLSGDSAQRVRKAAYATFRQRSTGLEFFVVSVHLDPRAGLTYDRLSAQQAAYVADKVAELNPRRLPVVFVGDLNSWQNQAQGNLPHDILIKRGYVDSFAAASKTRSAYSTENHWLRTVPANDQGFGSRLDVVLAKGSLGTLASVHVVTPTDSPRYSDHNLFYGRFRFAVPS